MECRLNDIVDDIQSQAEAVETEFKKIGDRQSALEETVESLGMSE